MAPVTHKSRIHLLAAREAPTIVILQRKRAKLFHVVTVDTETHRVEEGSWFRGVLYAMRCDVSFDGRYMVYHAMGQGSPDTWSGLCRLPWLKTLVDARGIGASWGGGYFRTRNVLATNVWENMTVPGAEDFRFLPIKPNAFTSEDPGIVYFRLERDGFRRLGSSWGREERLPGPHYQVACIGDDGWGNRPTPQHPELRVHYLGYFDNGHRLAFSLDACPGLIDEASWATWDVSGTLWVARPGVVAQYTLADLRRGAPSFTLDVDRFEPPAKTSRRRDISESDIP